MLEYIRKLIAFNAIMALLTKLENGNVGFIVFGATEFERFYSACKTITIKAFRGSDDCPEWTARNIYKLRPALKSIHYRVIDAGIEWDRTTTKISWLQCEQIACQIMGARHTGQSKRFKRGYTPDGIVDEENRLYVEIKGVNGRIYS